MTTPRPIAPAIRRSIAKAEWITDTDEGTARAAIRLAQTLDRSISTRDVAAASNALVRYLSALQLTPETRPKGGNMGDDELDRIEGSVASISASRRGVRHGMPANPR